VPTTLLLEGDDLEALLQRAHAEGGPQARIVRAEKIRHGGVLGFFAKERFEVALEIPDRPHFPASDDATPKGPTMSEATTSGATISQATMSEVTTTRAGAPDAALGSAFDRLTRRLVAAAEDPRVAAAEGLLGLAERADAVELAASLPGTGTPSATSGSAGGSDALDLALRRLLEQRDPEPAYAAPSPVQPSTSRPEFTALLDQLRTSTTSAPMPASMPVSVAASMPVSVAASMPAAYREVAASPAPVMSIPTQGGPAPIERQTLGRTRVGQSAAGTRDRREDAQLAADRRALRALGVPVAWTRQLRPGDRFAAVLRMLDRMPDVDIDPATRVVAVVGPASSVLLEAHRAALDLATGPAPRPVIAVPAAAGAERAAALAEARLLGDVVVAIEADGDVDVPVAVEALQAIGAGAVIAIVPAAEPVERSQAHLDALGQVDALAVEGTAASGEPAAVLQLGLPVVRLDGIPIDRYTWTAVLCAQLGPVAGS
jgi:hypothetical protein